MRNLVALVVLVACGGSTPSPEAPPPTTSSLLDCTTVANHVATTVAADKPRSGATHAAVKNLVETRCKADAWTDETKQCLHAIATIREGRACATKMTDAQRTALQAQAKALRKDASAEPDEDRSADWIKHVVEEPGTPTR
ncbi:MAG: hypothetical protein ABI867_16040 [Kofleriaceae bacterium]